MKKIFGVSLIDLDQDNHGGNVSSEWAELQEWDSIFQRPRIFYSTSDIHFSPEAIQDIKSWGTLQVDTETKKSIINTG